jgi:hypothetical protein
MTSASTAVRLVIVYSVAASLALAQNAEFPGLEKTMNAETYEMAGLSKLTAEERGVLDKFIREYAAGKQKTAASAAAAEAVNRALQEQKVRPPEIVESKMTGTFKGYGPRTRFVLENGEVWKSTNDEVVSYSPIENPKVVIYRDTFGYKMFIEGAGTIRVKRAK